MKFYHMLRSGISWKMSETIIELWHSSYDMKTSTTHSYCEDDTQNENDILNIDASKNESYMDGDSHCRKRIPSKLADNEDGDSVSDSEAESDEERQIGDGSNEDDLFLTSHGGKAVETVWQ